MIFYLLAHVSFYKSTSEHEGVFPSSNPNAIDTSLYSYYWTWRKAYISSLTSFVTYNITRASVILIILKKTCWTLSPGTLNVVYFEDFDHPTETQMLRFLAPWQFLYIGLYEQPMQQSNIPFWKLWRCKTFRRSWGSRADFSFLGFRVKLWCH